MIITIIIALISCNDNENKIMMPIIVLDNTSYDYETGNNRISFDM